MELTRLDSGTCAVLRVSGTVRALDASRLRDALSKATAEVPTCLVCDLSEVVDLDPVCVAVLVGAQWTAPWPGPSMWLTGAHGQPAEALRLTGAGRYLGLAGTTAAALAQQAVEPPPNLERLILAPLPIAARRARLFTRDVLDRWAVSDVADDAYLVVSELVTNAITHGRPPIDLHVHRTANEVVLEVQDRAVYRPRRRRAEQDDEHGRGLHIVSVLADRWGSRATGTGKSVWASRTIPQAR